MKRAMSRREPLKPWEKTTLNLASSLLTPVSAYARWRPSLSLTFGAVAVAGVALVVGFGTERQIHLVRAPETREPIADPRCRCLCIFPAQPSTGALASSSIAAAQRGRGTRVQSPGCGEGEGPRPDTYTAWLVLFGSSVSP